MKRDISVLGDENGNITGIKFFGMSSQEAMETFYGGNKSYRASY